jgi:hypothetical protein
MDYVAEENAAWIPTIKPPATTSDDCGSQENPLNDKFQSIA